jgi:pimeloyl-ACP methyl ester carboxylesterase
MIPTNGIRLHAVAAGAADSPMIILLHGFPDFWYGWHKQIELLAKAGFRVVVPDQRGYNKSDKPKKVDAYVVDELAKDIIGILDYYQRPSAIIAGHDWGAAVAWYLAMNYPERMTHLITVNVPHQAAMNQALTKPVLSQLMKSWYMFFFQIPYLPELMLSRNNFSALARTFLNTSRAGTFQENDIAEYRRAWLQENALTGGINWYRAMMQFGLKNGPTQSFNHFRKRIKMPTLLLWGNQDAFLAPFLADWSMDWVDEGKLVRFPTATHWLLFEEPDKVVQEMLQFLKDHPK